jgi:bacillithiol biosynthesis cysteine-adding enzyme BshC
MNCYALSYKRLAHTGKRFPLLFADYTSNNAKTQHITAQFFNGDFRNSSAIKEKLLRLEQINYQREKLVALLLEEQQQFNPSPKTLENIEKLRSPKTVAIVTGQQVGLFSGSLYTIYKTASAIALAKRYKRDFPDYDFVPIFWLEGEDHDYDEVAHVTILVGNELKTLRYEEKNYAERKMVGRTRLSEKIEPFVSEFLSLFPASDFKASLSNLIQNTYTQGETLLTAFAKLMSGLFQQDGLIFLTSDNIAYKSLAKEIFIKEFETFPRCSTEVIVQSALLEEEGYDAQAKARPINFYLIDEQHRRWAIEPHDEKHFVLKPSREEILKTSLLEIVYNAPEKLSPNVILRPIVQDKVLPTLAYIAGPSEVAYWAQLKRAYQFFGVEMPFVVPRASLTIVEQKISKVFEKIGGEFREARYEQFFTEKDVMMREYIAEHSDIKLESLFESAEQEVRQALAKLETSLKTLDASLIQTAETTQNKMLFQLGQLKEKAFRAEKQKQNDFLSQIEKCEANLLPMGSMQERVLNIASYLNKYGLSFIETIQRVIEESDFSTHLIVEL